MSRILIINVAPHDTAAHALSNSQTLLSLFYSAVLYFALKPNLKGLICPMTENEVFKGVSVENSLSKVARGHSPYYQSCIFPSLLFKRYFSGVIFASLFLADYMSSHHYPCKMKFVIPFKCIVGADNKDDTVVVIQNQVLPIPTTLFPTKQFVHGIAFPPDDKNVIVIIFVQKTVCEAQSAQLIECI